MYNLQFLMPSEWIFDVATSLFFPRMKEKSLNSLSGGGTQVSLSVFVLPLSSCLWREFVELAKLSWQKPRPDNVVNVCFIPCVRKRPFHSICADVACWVQRWTHFKESVLRRFDSDLVSADVLMGYMEISSQEVCGTVCFKSHFKTNTCT